MNFDITATPDFRSSLKASECRKSGLCLNSKTENNSKLPEFMSSESTPSRRFFSKNEGISKYWIFIVFIFIDLIVVGSCTPSKIKTEIDTPKTELEKIEEIRQDSKFSAQIDTERLEEIPEDSTVSISVADSKKTSQNFIGKTYVGFGNKSGLGIEMMIEFLGNGRCICTSDWYREFIEAVSKEGRYTINNETSELTVEVDDLTFIFTIGDDCLYFNMDEGLASVGHNHMFLGLKEKEE